MSRDVSLVSLKSALYPKEWIRTFCRSGSRGSQAWGQKRRRSSPLHHVLMEPPLSPWTNITSTNGSGGEYSRFNPYGPQESSLIVLTDLCRVKEKLFSALETDEISPPCCEGAKREYWD